MSRAGNCLLRKTSELLGVSGVLFFCSKIGRGEADGQVGMEEPERFLETTKKEQYQKTKRKDGKTNEGRTLGKRRKGQDFLGGVDGALRGWL